jgi:hypothetical protein
MTNKEFEIKRRKKTPEINNFAKTIDWRVH